MNWISNFPFRNIFKYNKISKNCVFSNYPAANQNFEVQITQKGKLPLVFKGTLLPQMVYRIGRQIHFKLADTPKKLSL